MKGLSFYILTYFQVTIMFLTGCANQVNYLCTDEALLPVMVKGKNASNDYLIVVAGGPAGDGLIYHYVFPFFKKLEKDYQVVYYDQRGSGNAKGSPAISSFTLDQHAVDLGRIVSFILDKDDEAKIYLVGYSYGGTIVLNYLNHPSSPVRGAITIEGAFDRRLQKQYQQRLTGELLKQWVDEGYIERYDYLTTGFLCKSDIENCRKDSLETLKKVKKRFKEIEKVNKFPVNLITIKNLLHYALFAPGNPIRSAKNESRNGHHFQSEFDSLTMTDDLNITTPTLLIAGRIDTNVPYYDAATVFEKMSTTSEQHNLLVLERSGHLPMFTEPELILEAIHAFIGRN